MVIKSSILSKVPGISHGFGTRDEPIPSIFLQTGKESWDLALPKWKQVHGSEIARVEKPGQECGEVDALMTRQKQIPLSVVTADCVPILLAHREGHFVAAVHAGWRGARARILKKLWKKLQEEEGQDPRDWVAAIGPAIGPCCYEVSPELAEDFKKEFSDLPQVQSVPRSRMLDLPTLQLEELKKIGLFEVECLRTCTKCTQGPEQPAFYSYRREGTGVRQWSVIMREESISGKLQ